MSIEKFLKSFYFYKFEVLLQTAEELYLPKYKGSAFRGGFGNIFKKLSCPLKKINCQDCFILSSCPYANVFSNPSKLKNFNFIHENSNTPHPYILDFDFSIYENKIYYKKGEKIQFSLILVGEAFKYIPYIIYSFIELGNHGIGKNNSKFEVISIKNNNLEIYDYKSKRLLTDKIKKIGYKELINEIKDKNLSFYSEFFLDNVNSNSKDKNSNSKKNKNSDLLVTLNFITPTRIKFYGRYINFLNFKILITNLIRRQFLLNNLFCHTVVIDNSYNSNKISNNVRNNNKNSNLSDSGHNNINKHVGNNKKINNLNFLNSNNSNNIVEELEGKKSNFYNSCFYNLNQYLKDSEKISVFDSNLTWYDWERYSNKQKTAMKLGGFIGKIVFKGQIEHFKKYLYPLLLGEEIHVGKGTTFGLGKYKIEKFKFMEDK